MSFAVQLHETVHPCALHVNGDPNHIVLSYLIVHLMHVIVVADVGISCIWQCWHSDK